MASTATVDATATIDTYLAMFNEADSELRAALVRRAWATDGTYLDPVLEGTGHEALNAMVDAVQERFPGSRMKRTSGIDAHHDLVRFGWQLDGADGAVIVAGIDVGILGADGRLTSIRGFFGDLPQTDA
jgi:hypothetical protein